MRPVLLALLLGGCATDGSDVACTLQLNSINVRVVDADGEPVVGMWTKTVHIETGAVLREEPIATYGYCVIDDLDVQHLEHPSSQMLHFFAQHDTRGTVSSDYFISIDRCGHVSLAQRPDAGPYELELQPF